LHHGHLVFAPHRKKLHVTIQQILFDLLSPLLRGAGFIAIELPFRPAAEYESWQCDLGFVLQERWDNDDGDYFMGAPDFVIEVLSRSNTMDEILDRQDVCFHHGCSTFWTVDPRRRTIMVTTADRRTASYDMSMELALPENIAQGTIMVAAVFHGSAG
jgi:Uma2 family endonuclease